jgi:hypothetical protein
MRVHSKSVTGLEDVWITRMNEALHLQDPPAGVSPRGMTRDEIMGFDCGPGPPHCG